jgi:hypothetical protein
LSSNGVSPEGVPRGLATEFSLQSAESDKRVCRESGGVRGCEAGGFTSVLRFSTWSATQLVCGVGLPQSAGRGHDQPGARNSRRAAESSPPSTPGPISRIGLAGSASLGWDFVITCLWGRNWPTSIGDADSRPGDGDSRSKPPILDGDPASYGPRRRPRFSTGDHANSGSGDHAVPGRKSIRLRSRHHGGRPDSPSAPDAGSCRRGPSAPTARRSRRLWRPSTMRSSTT